MNLNSKHIYDYYGHRVGDHTRCRNGKCCNLISMRKLKVLGDATVAQTNSFQALKTSCTIEVHEDMATSNGGNADATLQWAKDNRSAIVEFYDDAGNYVSTL